MRRMLALLLVLTVSLAARGEEGRVLKVFPQYLDAQGRHTLSPSLFARDAYQFYLRTRPKERGGMRVAVQWKIKGSDGANLRLRVEMRGLRGNTLRAKTLEKPAVKNGWFSHWTEVRLTGADYLDFGELVSWRVSLWDGPRELSSQQSFLWDGVVPDTRAR
jgi:hypothetical protein